MRRLVHILGFVVGGWTAWGQTLTTTPAALNFSFQQGAAQLPQAQTVQVTGQPPGFDFTVSVTGSPGNGAWVQLSATGGRAPLALRVQVNPTGLAVGVHSATLTVTAASGNPAPTRTVPITLSVTAGAATLSASPQSLTFTYVTGTPVPSPSLTQNLQLASSGGPISATVAVVGAPWLRANPSGAISVTGLFNLIAVTVDPRGLAPRAYTGTLRITTTGGAVRTIEIAVTMTIVPARPFIGSLWPPGLPQQSGPAAATLSVNGNAFFAGTTTAVSGFSPTFRVTVTDFNGASASETVNIPVYANAVSASRLRILMASPLPAATVGAAYSLTLSAGGGTAPLLWGVTDGALPPGLSLLGNVITGTPTAAGRYRFTLLVADSSAPVQLAFWQPFQMTVYAAGSALRVTMNQATPLVPLPSGVAAASYGPVTLSVSGGQAPYTWAATGLPAGLTIDPGGVLSNPPNSAGDGATLTTAITSDRGLLVTVPGTNFATEGLLRIAATVPGASDVSNEAFFEVFGPGPRIDSVTNSASVRSGTVSPGAILTIYGRNLGPAAAALFDPNTPPIPAALPVAAPSTTVLVGNKPAPILYTSETQVSVIAPFNVDANDTTVTLSFNGVASAAFPVTFAATDPAIYTLAGTGTGQAAALNFSSTSNDFSVNSTAAPAARGGTLVLYVTGAGAMSSSISNQLIPANPAVTPSQAPTVTIGGQSATVVSAFSPVGSVPGLLQLTVTVPQNAAASNTAPVVVTIGGVASPAGVTVAVR